MVNVEVPKKSIAIFTNFASDDEAYSLNRVVKDQIKMLVIHGYEPIVIVGDGFTPNDQPDNPYKLPQVKLKTIPSVPCHNEIKKDESFVSDVENIRDALKSILKDVSVVLTHDVVYQPACLKHNFAARQIAKDNKNIKWLHWIHSATSPFRLANLVNIFPDDFVKLLEVPFPNSYYIFFNHYSVPRISTNFMVPEEMVKVVYHPTDVFEFYGTDPMVAKLADEKSFLDCDAICTYPCRLDDGKQVEMAIKTMAMLKEFDMKVRMVVIDFHSTGGPKVAYRDRLKDIALDYGMNPQELTFTSEYCEDWRVEMPHKLVKDFMQLSNVFVMPSVSESYSLVTQEAALMGHIIVVNQDFPPFREIFGPNVIFRKYSSAIDVMNGLDGRTNTRYGPSDVSDQEMKSHEKRYHKDTAGMIAYRLRNYDSKITQIKIRRDRNLRAVFKKQLEPLFYD